MRVNGILSFLSFCDVCKDDSRSNCWAIDQFLRLRRLCSDDSDFSSKSEEICQFFEKRGYPLSVVKAGHHRAQQFDRESSLVRYAINYTLVRQVDD